MTPDESVEVGRISKQWSGLLKEAFTDTDNFGITYDPIFNILVSHKVHMGRERVFRKIKSPITSVKLFGMEKVSGITKKNFKIGTLEDFEKTYVLYVAMAEKPLSSGQKWFLR